VEGLQASSRSVAYSLVEAAAIFAFLPIEECPLRRFGTLRCPFYTVHIDCRFACNLSESVKLIHNPWGIPKLWPHWSRPCPSSQTPLRPFSQGLTHTTCPARLSRPPPCRTGQAPNDRRPQGTASHHIAARQPQSSHMPSPRHQQPQPQHNGSSNSNSMEHIEHHLLQ